ncbi:hypothetical protein MSAS_19810 [Mycobacterium saskatchewanense]|uniref:Uncharacterized protein n=1 Tax=Mycobacterium saskatchewanense TaxID=220927 RepID=A0AAJ3NQZ3_9MYCO|nr:hypothetical protein [Mycobacterium saskatchewanense]ORW72156.1 hypothetical protein AWC23_11580 [Mycobacterium saskatchewanense]BBX62807.1 hypothetical protein MSAS_19810 [Mycobacterium saskatchewanense]
MTDVTLASALISGIPSMLVALVGVGGVIYTQRQADARQDRIAAASREFEREARTLDKRREAAAELTTAVWQLAAHSRDVVPEGGEFADLEPRETAAVYRAHSIALMVLDAKGRAAAQALFDTLVTFVGDFSEKQWEAISDAEDTLIAVINGEQQTPPNTAEQ